jgi:LysR family transcriptional activator of nhaA
MLFPRFLPRLEMNYKHLHYFWMVARTGSVARASERLHLTPQTLSGQIKLLEDALDTPLFQPAGRGLTLTEAGRLALRYADEIFTLGDEMKSALRTRQARAQPLLVGLSDAVPKTIAHRLLAPATRLQEPVRLICREDKLDRLLGELAVNRLDMVLADRPLPAEMHVRGYNHRLLESELAFFAAPDLLAACQAPFPTCLDGAPLLLPGDDATARVLIERWLEAARLSPRIVGEFDDSALMKAFGQGGAGFFVAPLIIAPEIEAQYGVKLAGRAEGVRETFYAITAERQISHAALRAVIAAAHAANFSD